MRGPSPTLILFIGVVLFLLGERILGEGTTRDAVLIVGTLCALIGTGLRVTRWQHAGGAARAVEQRLFASSVGVIVAIALYFFADVLEKRLASGATAETAERISGMISVLWPSVLLVSALALVFMDFAYRRMPVPEAVELRRVQGAGQAGVSLALALVFIFSINYVANKRDVRRDLSYLKTSRPSESTLNIVRGLGEPIRVVLFYPRVNEVLDQIRPYFQEVDAASPKLTLAVRDQALSPELARKHSVRGNGWMLIVRGEGERAQAEQLEIGTDIEAARRTLRTLDGNFQEKLLRLTRVRRELHLTAGHGERTVRGADGELPGARIQMLDTMLRRSNFQIQPLGIGQGLASRVPEGVPAVAVIGPREPLIAEEANALLRYVQQGGRLIVMVDPNVQTGLDPLLHGLGVELLPGVATSSSDYVPRTRTPADRSFVFAREYSSHPTVTFASRNQSQVATLLLEGGGLKRYEGAGKPENANVVFPVKSSRSLFRDLNGNHEQDPDEPAEQIQPVAAITLGARGGTEGRAVVMADGDFVTDELLRNPGNITIMADSLQWLLGQESIVGNATSEEDVPIQHTREEDRAWFYATSFGVPLPLLGMGVWVMLRRRRRKETSAK